jgi:hypothetical protein
MLRIALLHDALDAMHTSRCALSLILLLATALVMGCDSGMDDREGGFLVEVRGDRVAQLEGSAQFLAQTASGSDEITAFEIVLTAQTSEILIESAEGSGAPQQATYSVEGTITGSSSQAVRVEFDPDRFTTTSELFIAESGTLTLTRVTDALVEGEFNLDARGTNDAAAEIILVGQFSVQR